jgi:hypothetical protein
MWLGDPGEATHSVSIYSGGPFAGDPMHFEHGASWFNTTNGFSANTWHHAIARVQATLTEGILDADFANKGSVAHSDASALGRTEVNLGRYGGTNPGFYWDDHIAEAAIWDVLLTDDDVTLLAAGYSPLFVKPESLLFYAPIHGRKSPENDLIAGTSLTVTGSPGASAHMPITYPEDTPSPMYPPPSGAVMPLIFWPDMRPDVGDYINHVRRRSHA